jgi:hypothetical protein
VNFLDRDPSSCDDEPDGDEPEDELCQQCNGSGEGYVDGSRCLACRGSGVTRHKEDDDAPDGSEERVAGGCVVLMPRGGMPWW